MPRGTHTASVIILLTDGENNQQPDPLAAAQLAADRGVRIYTVGIGSARGSTCTSTASPCIHQLDEATLQQISLLTDGEYYNAETEEDLLAVYDSLSPELIVKPEALEVTPLFAGAGLLVC
ncbi:MAG: VWA domain-containing protein [Anaerolineae bacterium]